METMASRFVATFRKTPLLLLCSYRAADAKLEGCALGLICSAAPFREAMRMS